MLSVLLELWSIQKQVVVQLYSKTSHCVLGRNEECFLKKPDSMNIGGAS